MSNNATFIRIDIALGGFDAEILVHSGKFLDAAIKENEVVQQLDESFFAAHL